LQIVDEAQRTNDVVSQIRSMALRRPAQETDLALSLPPVRADRVLMQQVIVNLVMNAAQAMASANSSTRELIVRSEVLADNEIRLEVLDSGPGIAPGLEGKLFDSFFTTKATGMGMGLPICRSIVEAAGGLIQLANRDDGKGGAKVAFTLPALPPPSALGRGFPHASP
jgi:signal transduction histidine kinase